MPSHCSEPSIGSGTVPSRRALIVGLSALLLTLSACSGDPEPVAGTDDATAPDASAGGPTDDDESDLTPGEKTAAEEQIENHEALPQAAAPSAGDTARLCFSPGEDCVARLLARLRAENRAVDVAIYHLYDSRISRLLVAKQRAGVRVRVIADRHAYNAKPQNAREMNFLASNGVPVRANRHRGIVHDKLVILHGLGLVEQGSMNYTSIASRKVTGANGRTEWNEELAFFTTNARAVARFKERFDRMWANAGAARQTFEPFRAGMRLPTLAETEANPPTTCYENPRPDPRPVADDATLRVCFAPDQNCNRDDVVPIVRRQSRKLDIFMFRATSFASFADDLVAKVKAGVPVRIIFEPTQYRNPLYPNMTAVIDALVRANTKGNLRMKVTAHQGFMHMKGVIGSDAAAWGSGNYSLGSSRVVRGCQRTAYSDEDMVVTRRDGLVRAVQARFDEMWNGRDFTDFARQGRVGGGNAPE